MEEGQSGGVVQSRKEKLAVISKALDRVQSGATKRDTVLQVLETCLGTVSSWNTSEDVDMMDEDGCARIAYDSIRILVQIALLLYNFAVAGFEPAKVKMELENLENVFMQVINCSERRALEELLALGKVVSLLEMQVARNGAGILKGCCLQFPLSNTSVSGGQDDEALDPEKLTTLRINDLEHLFGLKFVWSNVVLRLLVSQPLLALGCPGISLLVYEQLAAYSSTTLDTPFSTQYRLCKALVQLGSIGLAIDLERKYDAFEGLLACVKAYLGKALNGVQSRGGVDGSGGFNATSANDMHIIVSTITAVFSALECILWPIGRSRSGPNEIGSSIGLIVFKLATLLNDNIVVNRSDLCEPVPTAATGVKGKAMGKTQAQSTSAAPTKAVLRQEAAIEANKQITYVLAAKILSLLRRAIQADPSCCPSLFFLSQCSINVGTQAAVAGCLLTALRGSGNAAGAIVQWADSLPPGVSSGVASAGGGDASGGKKSKKTSFAPDDTGAGGGGGGGKASSDSKRHKAGSKAGAPIESPFAAAAGGAMAVEEADAEEDASSGRKPLLVTDSHNRSAVGEPFLLSELQVLFFVLQELSHAGPASLSTDAALKKMTVACLLFESICAAKVIVGRSGLDIKDDHAGNSVESSVSSAYFACHSDILRASLVNAPKSRGGDAKEVENPQAPPTKRARQQSSLPITTGEVASPVAASNAAAAAAASAASSRKSYMWATVQSLCRVLALCPGHLTQPSSALLELLSTAVEVALPQAVQLSVELEKRFGAVDNLFVPGPVCCQSWLRDVFHQRGSSVASAKALTHHASPLSSYADASNFLFTSIDAFEDLYLANDLSSLCLHLATVPVLTGSSYHFPLIDGHILEDCQRHYMLAFAARHVQQVLTGPLSFSADGLDKSLRLVNEFLVFVVKASDTPFAAGTGHFKDPFSSRVMFDSLTSVMAHVSALLLKSFSTELRALKKCFSSSAPLKMALVKDPGSSNSSDPVGDLLSIQLLKQTDRWVKVSKIYPSGLNPTEYLAHDEEVHQSSNLVYIVAPSLSKLWNNLKSKVAEIVRVAEDGQSSSNASSSKEPQAESGSSSFTLGSSGNSYWARQATIGCSLLDFLIQFRSVLAVVPLCIENETRSQDLKASLNAVTDELDNHVNLLMQSSVVDFHPVQCRLSQLVAISMLDHVFKERPLMSEDHSRELFAKSKRSTHYTLLGSQVVDPPIGGNFGRLLLEEVALLQKEANQNNNQQPANTQGIVNKVFDINKRSHDRKVVLIKAFASFFEHSVLLNPAAAVWALSSIIELWIHSDLFSTVARKCFEELSNLKKLIQYLMAANPDLVTEWIVVPLILRVNSPKEKDHSKNVIFNLTVTMFGSTTPDEPAASVEAGSSNHLSANLNSSVGGGQSSKDEEALGPGKFPVFTADSIIVKLSACHDQKRTTIARLRLLEGFDNKVYKDVASWAKGNLIDERPNLFYLILVSPVVQEMDDKDLVRGGLHAYLQDCARQLALTVQAEDQTDSPVINVTTKQRVLIFLVWDLGSSDEKHEIALRALKVLATILKANKWSVPAGRTGGRAEASMAADLNENVSLLLSESFLYIMSNLLQYKWNERTQLQQEQCVRSLRRLVCLLKQSDLTKFLPKIMIVVDRVLGSDSPRVRFAGVELVSELCNRLPHDVLCDNLSALVVGLFHIAEKSTDSSPGKDQTRPALDDLRRLGVMYQLDFRIHEPCLHYQNNDRNSLGLSRDMCYVLEAAYAQEAAVNWARRAKKSAIAILKTLFLSRRRDISRGIQWVTCIPDIPELEAVRTLHAEEHRSMSLDETLKLLIKMFRHDTLHVRTMALNRLLVVIRENKSALYRIIESSATNAAYSAIGSGKQDTVSLLLQELLMLSTRETEEDVLDVCALCLGEMGAIDPAHVQIDVLASSKPSWVCTVSIPPGSSAHSNPFVIELFGDINSQPPWLISTLQLGLVLLEHHLVPSMKSSNAAGADSVGFAIQQILYLIWDDIQTLPNQGTSAAAVSSSASASKGPKLPDLLADILQQRSIFEVTEPYWNTKYRSVAQEPSPSPVYKSGMFSSKWMSMWLRRMIAFSDGKNQKILEACRGVLSKRPALSQFILPTTVVSYLVNPSSINSGAMNINNNDDYDDDELQAFPQSAADRAYNDVLAEICHVLKGGESIDDDYSERLSVISPEDMAVQAVFSLLDTLSTWSSKGLAAKPRRQVYDRTVPPGGGSVGSTTNQTHESVDEDVFEVARKTGVVVRKLVDAVPKMLLASAALSIKAYARALRYLELHLREQPSRPERADSSSGSTSDLLLRTVHDGSNGQLPPLGPTQIDTLMQIFSKLEAPDTLQGLLVVAQKMGQRPSSTNRLLELEHSDDWLGALLEYGLISSPASASAGRGGHQLPQQSNRAAATPYTAIAGQAQFSAPTTIAPSGDMDVDEPQKKNTDAAGGGALDPEAQAAIHERGRLKCLMELGHLDAVVDQALGTIQRTPSLEPALAPLGVEASWRLMQWSDLSTWLNRIDAIDNQPEMSSLLLPEDAFNVSVGKLFLSLRLHEKNDFDFEMTEARRTIMQALSAASMESYRRAYPLLVRLQILQELEEGFTLITSKTLEEKTDLLTNKWFWEPRIESMSPSMTHRSFVLATRRTLLGASGLPHLVAENWVDLATRLSHLGRYEAARIALQYAGEAGLDVQECVLRESRLLKEAGHVHKALMLLEPVEPDFYRIGQLTKMPVIKALSDTTAANATDSAQLKAAVDHLARTDPTCSLPPFLTCLENKIAFSERLLLGTQLVIDCRAKHGSQVIERYQCLVDLRPNWELAHFHLARYHEYLYHEFKRKDLQDLLAADPDGGKGRTTTQVSMAAKGKGADQNRQEDYCSLMCGSLRHALKSYCKSIVYGTSATTLTQALPRMLTLWFSCTSPEFGFATARAAAAAAAAVASGKSSAGEKETQRSEKLALLKSSANKVIVRFKDSIESHIWFACMPQLVSRTGHKNPETLSLVKDLVLRVLTSYPQQGVWHIAGLVHSLVPARKKIGEALITEACAELKKKTDSMYNRHLTVSVRTECAEMLLDAKKLFQNLVELAALQHKDRRLKWLWPSDINNIRRILVPNQHVLARAAPIIDTSRTRPASDTSASSDHGATFQYIQSFNDMVDVAASKAKPKTIYLTTTSGGAVKFLCKQEKNGDLRKDARMMEFNTVINRLLQHDLEGRRRNLRLRTYAVVCLNEECGILEWVGNTTCIRHLIRDSHQYYPQRFNNIDTKTVYHPFLEMQEKHQDDMAALVHHYQHLVLNKYQPCFHRWFIERFSDPTAWLESRLTFTRSCAIWAVVGHVVGLGDRHTENVLLDTTNGECVHVDFDCLFDKGLQLARPEIVPFRLTPNLVDAMGLTGVEGVFRRTMEVSMSLLRENKETLLSVLEPFLRDPTVAWGRGGRAQRQDVAPLKGSLNTAQKTTAEQSAVVEAENPEVKEALEKITGRLNGIYNLTNPAAERIHRRYLQKNQPLPAFGMGAGRDEAQSLSVQGQVARLIDEAKAVENLAQMYIGWTPWQ